MSRTVAITGGSGFIGKKLAYQHLEAGDTVRILSRKPRNILNFSNTVQIYQGNLSQPSKVLNEFVDGADILYHCASELRNETFMYQTNLEGTRHLLNAAIGKIGRWIQLSSVGVYGPHKFGTITESTPFNPIGIYEITKTKSDLLVLENMEQKKIFVSFLRPSNVYGPDMSNRSVFQLIRTIDKGLFFFIGKPGSSANYIHADNVVHALMLCGSKQEALGKIYNLSDYCLLEDLVTCISNNLGKKYSQIRVPEFLVPGLTWLVKFIPRFPLTQSRVKALTTRSYYPINQIQKELGYQHLVSMEQGIGQMVQQYLKN